MIAEYGDGRLLARIWNKVHVVAEASPTVCTPCWIWDGGANKETNGEYPLMKIGGVTVVGHRHVYKVLIGPIPEGLVLDHLCKVTRCVNPSHLEPVTQRENLLRGNTFQAKNASKTHCVNGHPFDEDNTARYNEARGPARRCKTCERQNSRDWREKNLEKALAVGRRSDAKRRMTPERQAYMREYLREYKRKKREAQ